MRYLTKVLEGRARARTDVFDLVVGQAGSTSNAVTGIGMVEQVEDFQAQLHGQVFLHLYVLEDPSIDQVKRRPLRAVAWRVSEWISE